MSSKSVVIGVSVGVVVAVVAVGCGVYALKKHRDANAAKAAPPAGFEPAEAVNAVEARTISWQPAASMVGTVFALRSIVVSNEVAGTVREVGFESGVVVDKGATLLVQDTTTEEADLRAAEATVAMAGASRTMMQSALELAELRSKRIGEALEHKAASAMDADAAKSEVDTARANLTRIAAEIEQARARAEQVRTVMQKKRIVAPFRARVGIRSVHPGQYLKEGTEIVALQGVEEKVYLDFALPQEEARRVGPGAEFMVTSKMLGPKAVPISVVGVDAQANMTTRNVRVRGIVDNPGGTLRPGMAIEVTVPIEEAREYVAVPLVAVRHATYGDHVFVLGASGKQEGQPGELRAKQRFVKLGPTVGPNVIVLDGLKAGERIAGEGSFKLRDGGLVVIAPAAGPGRPGNAGAANGKSATAEKDTTRP